MDRFASSFITWPWEWYEWRRHRYDLFEWIADLVHGEPMAWIAGGMIGGCIAFFIIYEKVTGEPFVKSREERRESARRRGRVIWEYRRDDD